VDLEKLIFPAFEDPRLRRRRPRKRNDDDDDDDDYNNYKKEEQTASTDNGVRKLVDDFVFTEKFFIELGNVASNISMRHILAELFEDMNDFIVNCTYNAEDCQRKR
jgi:hypothetical protein